MINITIYPYLTIARLGASKTSTAADPAPGADPVARPAGVHAANLERKVARIRRQDPEGNSDGDVINELLLGRPLTAYIYIYIYIYIY